MSRTKLVIFLILCHFVTACAQFDAFVDRRREAGGMTEKVIYVGESTEDKPAICYNKLYTSYEEVKALADQECKKNNKGDYAKPLKETIFTCRLLIPNHYYFECVKDDNKKEEK